MQLYDIDSDPGHTSTGTYRRVYSEVILMSKAEWMSKKETIDLLGISERTLRRRKETGRYRYRYVKGHRGPQLRLRKEDILKDVHPCSDPGQQGISVDKSVRNENNHGHAHDEDMSSSDVTDRSALRVLLVDESETAIDFLSTLLRKAKAEVISARDGETGLRLMEEEHPDVAILEIAIPKIDGFEWATMKADNEKIREIPIIFYSYLLREHSFVEEARSYPKVVRCFKKPLAGKQLEEFQELIEEMMESV